MIDTTSPTPGPEPVGRAAPMSPEDRRAAILAATVPLLRARGVNLTTRELAAAAGVAEGTLFRVFPDKAALIRAAVEQALDPAETVAALDALPRGTGLRPTLTRAVGILVERAREAAELLVVIHAGVARHGVPGQDGEHGGHSEHGGHGAHESHGSRRGDHPVQVVIAAMTGLLAGHRDRLRWDPGVCARMLVGLVLVNARMLPPGGDASLDPAALVTLFLDGALTGPTTAPETSC